MRKLVITAVFILLLSFPANGIMVQPSIGIIFEESSPIYFDETNSSLVDIYLSNQITTYNVYFIGSAWPVTLITNWDNTGQVYFRDSVQLTVASSDINGSVFIEGAVILEFDTTTITNVEIKAANSELFFDNCQVSSMSNGYIWGNYYSSISLINSVLNQIYNAIIFYGDGSIKKSLLIGETRGMNITMDIQSSINGQFLVSNTNPSPGHYEIEGLDGISFFIDINGHLGDSQAYIHDLTLYTRSYFDDVYNLTISNITFDYPVGNTSTKILEISSSNGTVTNVVDPIIGDRLIWINSYDSNITFANIDMGGYHC